MCTIKKDGNCSDDDFNSMNSSTYEDPLLVTKRIINRYNLKKYGLNINEQEYLEIVDELKKLNKLMQDVYLAIGKIPGQVTTAITEQINKQQQLIHEEKEGFNIMAKYSASPSTFSQISDDIEILDLIKNDSFEQLNLHNKKWHNIVDYGNDNISEDNKSNKVMMANNPNPIYYQNDFYLHWKRNYQKNQAKAADSSLCWLSSCNNNQQSAKIIEEKMVIPNKNIDSDMNVWLK